MNPNGNCDSIPTDWTAEPAARLKRKNQVLFAKDSPFLYDLEALLQGTITVPRYCGRWSWRSNPSPSWKKHTRRKHAPGRL